jgi:hypothetical protein
MGVHVSELDGAKGFIINVPHVLFMVEFSEENKVSVHRPGLKEKLFFFFIWDNNQCSPYPVCEWLHRFSLCSHADIHRPSLLYCHLRSHC